MLPVILGLSGPALTADERSFFAETEPAGFILFRRNCQDPAQLRALTDDLRALTGRDDLPILIDQEGGRVNRLPPPLWPDFPAQARFGDLYRRAPLSGMEAARVNAAAIGSVLVAAGINIACLPMLDLELPGASTIVGDRSYGGDPLHVAALGRAVLDGLADAGVAGVIKHMPGHGRATVDSHHGLPVVTASEVELADDLLPFARLADRATIGMTAHIIFTAWDAHRPATQSPAVIDTIIRDRIGFDGLLLSDDIAMSALTGPIADRAAAALDAGCDLVLHCSGVTDEARTLRDLPPITERARERLAAAIPAPREPLPLEPLLAKRDALLAV